MSAFYFMTDSFNHRSPRPPETALTTMVGHRWMPPMMLPRPGTMGAISVSTGFLSLLSFLGKSLLRVGINLFSFGLALGGALALIVGAVRLIRSLPIKLEVDTVDAAENAA